MEKRIRFIIVTKYEHKSDLEWKYEKVQIPQSALNLSELCNAGKQLYFLGCDFLSYSGTCLTRYV